MKKAQSAIEFLILIAALGVIFIMALGYFQGNLASKEKENTNLLVKDIASQIQEEISIAAAASDGYRREFALPETIFGRNYTANLTENMACVATSDRRFALCLPADYASGQPRKGINTISKIQGSIQLN
jgi:hypothetical protein